MTPYKSLRYLIPVLLFIVAMSMSLLAAVSAQDGEPDDDGLILVQGTLELNETGIMVNGYKIAPASAFIPARYEDGDSVIITGVLLPDGETIQALSLELFDEDPEATPEATEAPVEETPEATEPAPETTPEATEPAPEETEPAPMHPVGARIAAEYGVSYEEVMALKEQGYGFGEIMILLGLAEETGQDYTVIQEQRESGMGWGQVAHANGLNVGDIAPGRHRQNDGEATDEPEDLGILNEDDAATLGITRQPNGQGNGNGGNGQGNGNGNGGGNGNRGGQNDTDEQDSENAGNQDNGGGNGQGNGNAGGNGQGNGGNGQGNGQGNGGGNGGGRGNNK